MATSSDYNSAFKLGMDEWLIEDDAERDTCQEWQSARTGNILQIDISAAVSLHCGIWDTYPVAMPLNTHVSIVQIYIHVHVYQYLICHIRCTTRDVQQ